MEFVVDFIKGKLYRLQASGRKMQDGSPAPFVVGDATKPVWVFEKRGWDFETIFIPSDSIILYLGLFKHEKKSEDLGTNTSYSFLFDKKIILFHKAEVDDNLGKHIKLLTLD